MADIIVNEKKVTCHFNNITPIEEIINQLTNDYASDEDILTDIIINGEWVDIVNNHILYEGNFGTIECLNLTFKSLQEVGSDFLHEAKKTLSEILNSTDCLLHTYKSFEDISNLNQEFATLTLKLENFIKFFQIVFETSQNILDQEGDFMQKFNSLDNHLLETLEKLVKARELNDYVMLTDILEYELHPNIQKWSTQIVPQLEEILGV